MAPDTSSDQHAENDRPAIYWDAAEVVLEQLPARSVDLVILDPPYWKVADAAWDKEWRFLPDYAAWFKTCMTEIVRVMKRSASLFVFGYTRNLLSLWPALDGQPLMFRQDITIDKGLSALGGRATRQARMFSPVTEMLWFFQYDSRPYVKSLFKQRQAELGLTAKTINERMGAATGGGGIWSLVTGDNNFGTLPSREMWDRLCLALDIRLPYDEIRAPFNPQMGVTDVWRDVDFHIANRIHPTQKPVALMRRLVEATTAPGMTVLDPFMGSGSSAVACIETGRHFIGIERDLSIRAAVEARLAQHQLELEAAS